MSSLSVGLILLLYIIVKSNSREAIVKVSLSEETKPYGEHADCHCSFSIDSSSGLSNSSEIMKQRNVSSAWIPVRKQKLPDWTWVNGVPSVNNIIIPSNISSREVECGFLKTQNRQGQVVAKCCFEKHPFLCQGKGIDMSRKWFSLKDHDQIFSINDKPSASWYEARTLCEKNNQTLAVLLGNLEYDRALIEKLSILNEEKEQNVWIGVRRWDYFTDSCAQRKLVEEYFWHNGLDCRYTSDSCVIVKIHGGVANWMPAPCCSSHHHLCIKGVTHIGDSSVSSPSNMWKNKYPTIQFDDISSAGKGKHVIRTILPRVVIAFVVLLLFLTAGILVWMWYRKKSFARLCERIRGANTRRGTHRNTTDQSGLPMVEHDDDIKSGETSKSV